MRKRILVVDDHAATRALITAVLRLERGITYEAVEAANGAECLRAIDTQGPFDLVLLDVELPDADGLTLCKAIRDSGNKVPIVFVTSRNSLTDYKDAQAAGGDSYVVKPINRAQLKSMVALFTAVARKGDGAPDIP
jgi:two-component system OmpR family response regulator